MRYFIILALCAVTFTVSACQQFAGDGQNQKTDYGRYAGYSVGYQYFGDGFYEESCWQHPTDDYRKTPNDYLPRRVTPQPTSTAPATTQQEHKDADL